MNNIEWYRAKATSRAKRVLELEAELAELRRFKALALQVFGYPRHAEMLSLSPEDRVFLEAQFEEKEG